MVWASKYKELISGHGISYTDIIIWKYYRYASSTAATAARLEPVARLAGHESRVLGLVLNSDHSTLGKL